MQILLQMSLTQTRSDVVLVSVSNVWCHWGTPADDDCQAQYVHTPYYLLLFSCC